MSKQIHLEKNSLGEPDGYKYRSSVIKNRELYLEFLKPEWIVEVEHHPVANNKPGKGKSKIVEESSFESMDDFLGEMDVLIGHSEYLRGFEDYMNSYDPPKVMSDSYEKGYEAGKTYSDGYEEGHRLFELDSKTSDLMGVNSHMTKMGGLKRQKKVIVAGKRKKIDVHNESYKSLDTEKSTLETEIVDLEEAIESDGRATRNPKELLSQKKQEMKLTFIGLDMLMVLKVVIGK